MCVFLFGLFPLCILSMWNESNSVVCCFVDTAMFFSLFFMAVIDVSCSLFSFDFLFWIARRRRRGKKIYRNAWTFSETDISISAMFDLIWFDFISTIHSIQNRHDNLWLNAVFQWIVHIDRIHVFLTHLHEIKWSYVWDMRECALCNPNETLISIECCIVLYLSLCLV